MSSPGVEWLRDRRGHERVSFDDVADHLEDFVRAKPSASEVVDRLAAFLARVDDVDHEHEGQGPTLSREPS
jgi:hypothetical protein